MLWLDRSLTDFSETSNTQIRLLFSLADRIQEDGWSCLKTTSKKPLVGLIFFEPSTRTSTSFEIAALKSNYLTTKVTAETSSAMKGETVLDTVMTLKSLGCDLFVVRHGGNESLKDIAQNTETRIISGGESTIGHPTQALLDVYTLEKSIGDLNGKNVLFVGDVAHSRVVASHLELLPKLGANIGVCGPKDWWPNTSSITTFENLEESLGWANAVVALRIQKERQATNEAVFLNLVNHYQLNEETLKKLSPDSVVLHPGPFNRRVEIADEVLLDPRCRIWNQVENGLYIRGALMALILGRVG